MHRKGKRPQNAPVHIAEYNSQMKYPTTANSISNEMLCLVIGNHVYAQK